jgi:exonuclease VII large subunit
MSYLKTGLSAITITAFVALAVYYVSDNKQQIQLQDIQVKSKESQLIQLNSKYDTILKEKVQTDQQKLEQQKKIDELENERKRLEGELQAKLQRQQAEKQKLATAAQNVSGTAKVSAASGNFYKDFIYHHESGNRTTAVNSIGCRGIGQACPGTKLPCGDDYACQDAWFTNYAMQRYGSWENAYNFWVANRWW